MTLTTLLLKLEFYPTAPNCSASGLQSCEKANLKALYKTLRTHKLHSNHDRQDGPVSEWPGEMSCCLDLVTLPKGESGSGAKDAGPERKGFLVGPALLCAH